MAALAAVAVINQARTRPERRAHMAALLRATGLEAGAEFVEPVRVAFSPSEYPRMSRGNLSLALTVMRKVLPRHALRASEGGGPAPGDPRGAVLVLEDDVGLYGDAATAPRSVLPRIHALLAAAPADWQMLYLEYCMTRCQAGAGVFKSAPTGVLRRAVRPYCAAAVLFRRAAVPAVLACFDAERDSLSWTYSRCVAAGRLAAYLAVPPVFAQDVRFAPTLDHDGVAHRLLGAFVRAYPTSDERRRLQAGGAAGGGIAAVPRLPPCTDDVPALLTYVRWGNVALALAVVVLAVAALALAVRRVRMKVRVRGG